jgi:hypothetical protein
MGRIRWDSEQVSSEYHAANTTLYLIGIKPESSLLGVAIALEVVIIMPVLWIQKRMISTETNCAPLSTDALQSATCFLMAVGGLLANCVKGSL